MDRITALQKILDERGLPLLQDMPECVQALAQRLRLSSYWELAGLAAALGLALANLKALPLVHTLRLLPSVRRLLAPRLFGRGGGKGKQKKGSDGASSSGVMAAHPSLFRHNISFSSAILLDLDINMHKSNSTFFADADVSRAALLTSLFSDALAARGGALFVLAGAQCKFLREIKPLQRYAVASQILTWTDKAFYTVTYFVAPRRGDVAAVCGLKGGPAAVLKDDTLRRKVFAVMVSKYVFKAGRATVAPAEVFGAAELLLSGDEKSGVKDGKKGGELLSADEVKKVVQDGMQFVQDCML
ncbi:thioesterase atnL [Apiospora marii]|uniref:Thioesterase atnL n=1 Tax=Apiospora marii TaxID=335849 RepID=A0ABR1RLT7_9PEZI